MKPFAVAKIACTFLLLSAMLGAFAQDGTVAAQVPEAPASAKTVKAADRALQKKVRRVLAKAKGLDITNVTVRARGGVVTLQGAVPDAQQVDLAGRVANGVEGVTSVKNDLRVRSIDG
ncbi:BON domain-containing protein [Paraburkholderia pallida]|uniref:BON domain-containing protein n=1 Tax=Paraburkholderia pallida TaxID=2547399 RepID=A0A4P7D423_9BURK|nr:BON domain-containing protein [Paraburkholderia pallida]QBR01560.1 BON domain-containing protein [Paraburkholderia pallida]